MLIHVPVSLTVAASTARAGFVDVMVALILREGQARYGERGLGYFWGLIEPAAFVTLYAVWAVMTDRVAMVGWPMPLFLITGVGPFIVFYRIDQFVRTSIVANTGLLYHPAITPLHLMVARFLLVGPTELFFLFLVFAAYGIGWREPGVVPVDYIPVIEALGIDLLFAFGVGGAIAPIMIRFPGLGWMLGFLVRVIFMTAGVHYVPDYAPTDWQPIIYWNPMTHIISLFRTGFGTHFPAHHLSPSYALAVGVTLVFIALVMERFFGRQWIEG